MTQMISPTTAGDENPPYKPMPAWLALTIIALCVVGSAGLLWWWFSDARRPILVDLPAAAVEGRPGRRAQVIDDNWTDDARSLGGGNWAVRAGDNRLFVSRRDDKDTFRLVYGKDLVEGDDRALIRAASTARREDGAKQLGLTEEQKAALAKLPRLGATAMKTSPADKERVGQLWAAFVAAPDDAKDAAEQAVLAAVKEIGDANREASVAQLKAQVEAVTAALTPEQIETAKKAAQ